MGDFRETAGRALGLCAAFAVLLVLLPGTSTAAPTITEFGPAAGISTGADPVGITEGPDGNMWFAEYGNEAIGRITPAGVATEFTAGITPGALPWAITAGPDGNVWYSDRALTEFIGRVTPLGVVTEFPVSMPSDARDMTLAPDGNVWFTQPIDSKIAKITPAGVITEYGGLPESSSPESIALGPDGNLWFTLPLDDAIGVMNTSGVLVNLFTAGISLGAAPQDITAGPDEALWFTAPGNNEIGRITTAGVVAESGDVLPDIDAGLQDITLGPDGNLWFTANLIDQVGSISTNGEVTFDELTWYGVADGITPGAGPHGITTGPDDTIWFTERGISHVARISDIIDTTPPDTVIDSGPAGAIAANQATFEFSGFPEDDTELIQCRIDGWEDYLPCTSPWTFTDLAEGPHTVDFRAEDAVGNQDPTPASRTFTVDTTPPDTVIDSGPSGTIATDQATFEFSGSPEIDTALIQCRIDAEAFDSCTSPQVYTDLADGPHTVEFRAEDDVGNQDPTPASRTFTVEAAEAPAPRPVVGKEVVVDQVKGKVVVKVPGSAKFVPLEEVESIPVGTLVDTRRGTVELTSAKSGSATQTARFKYGLFKVTQPKKAGAYTVLSMSGPLVCPKPAKKRSLLGPITLSSARISAGAGRRLWGRGKGRFTSKGKRGSGSARGTTWQVTDRCDGSTAIKSVQGRVTARDLVRKKTVILRTGKTYVARPPRR